MNHLLAQKAWQVQGRRAKFEKKSSLKVRSEPLNETSVHFRSGAMGKIL
jgi:hypothetical protein